MIIFRLFQIIVVDDGSSDDSLSLLHNLSSTLPVSCRVIVHPMSCGQSTSVFHGVLQAKGKWIITLDADGQNDPADIPRLIRAAKDTNTVHFCVIGHRKKRKDTPWKRFQSKVANRVRQWILQDDTPDTGCGLKLLPRSTFLLLPYFDHMHRYMPALVKAEGYAAEFMDVNHRPRGAGKSNYTNFGRLWAALSDLRGVTWLIRRRRNPGGADEL
jgi:glycosyltransferase involved in cell wall biosynthesis